MMKSVYSFKALNYLGSKLRLLDFIEDNVREYTPRGNGICDLFSGSGCVSYRLSKDYPIVSCDIQRYSRIICNALLHKSNASIKDAANLLDNIRFDRESAVLDAFVPLIELEEAAIKAKDLDILAEILEHGSVEVFNLGVQDTILSEKLSEVSASLRNANINDASTLVSRYYGGVYFSYRQAAQMDLILNRIHETIPDHQKDLYLAALLSTASDVAGTVGKHFAQPLKARDSYGNVKATVYNKAVKDKTIDIYSLYADWLNRYISLPRSSFDHIIIQGDYEDCIRLLPENVKTIYADPPYTRDHYSRFYHVLETMALRDSPEISTVRINGNLQISNGIYRRDRHQSPFCIRSKALEAFRKMFVAASSTNRNLLLSYSPYDESKKVHPRVVTIQQLISMAENHYDNVRIVSAGHFVHNKLNSIEHFLESSDEAEILIICSN